MDSTAAKFEDEQLLLSPDEAELIETFRRDVRRCGTDDGKLQLCAEMRGRLLEQHTQVELLVALFERVMLVECPGYRRHKSNRAKASRSPVDAEDEWDRFIGVAANGLDTIRKCLPHLKAVSVRWGREKLQYYKWSARGWLFCKRLGAVANKMAWREFVIKANQLLLRRAQMDGKFRRHRIRESPDPLDLVELENVGRWIAETPYVKMKDPENVVLPFEELSVRDLLSGYSFDRFGLLVRWSVNFSDRVDPEASGFNRTVEDRDAHTGSENSEHLRSIEPPIIPCSTFPRPSRLSTPLSSPPGSPCAAAHSSTVEPGHTISQEMAEKAPVGDDNHPDNGLCEDELGRRSQERPHHFHRATSNATALARLRPRQDKPNYHEFPPKSAKQANRLSAPTPRDRPPPTKPCCPLKIPPKLITILDKWDASATQQILHTFMSPDVPLEEMCHAHLKRLAEALKSAPSVEAILQVASCDKGPRLRQRRTSLPDLSDSSPLKRPRLSEQQVHTQHYIQDDEHPTIDVIRYEAYRQ